MQNIYAETTFVCPSYWMAQGYTDNGRKSYKYQNSVLPAVHASDMTAYLGPAAPYQGVDLERASMSSFTPPTALYVTKGLTREIQLSGETSSQKTTLPFLQRSPMAILLPARRRPILPPTGLLLPTMRLTS